MATLLNDNPTVFATCRETAPLSQDDNIVDDWSESELFDLLRNINDPEHPLTLEQLNVIRPELIKINKNLITINFTPTIPHCSMATLIGLSIRVQLIRTIPERFKVDIKVTEGTHQSEGQVNKQLNDKERVAAALENTHLLKVVNQCLARTVQ
jgi:metal-sulfur cluster biosynthetic enzyme